MIARKMVDGHRTDLLIYADRVDGDDRQRFGRVASRLECRQRGKLVRQIGREELEDPFGALHSFQPVGTEVA